MSRGFETEPLVALERVTCRYDAEAVLVAVDLAVGPGQYTGIVGPSGSGKTTLLRAILGTVAPVEGRVRRLASTRVAYVPQVDTVNWSFPVTVAECVLMSRRQGLRPPWASRAERSEVAAVLERLGIGDLARRHIRALSGGQQQRVFLARALLGQPDLLLLDEPTSGMDVRTRHEILLLLGDLHRNGLTVVVTTHDLNGVAAHLPHLVCLNRAIVAAGAPAQVLTPAVLERTYGAQMDVIEHGGVPVVLDGYRPDNVVALRRAAGG